MSFADDFAQACGSGDPQKPAALWGPARPDGNGTILVGDFRRTKTGGSTDDDGTAGIQAPGAASAAETGGNRG